MKNKEILITGGAGFIGSHLADKLKDKNSVKVFDNFSNPAIKKKRSNVSYIKEDIQKQRVLEDSFKDVDVVFHLAAATSVKKSSERPFYNFENNAKGTLNVLEAARKKDVPKVVFASSSTVYGLADELPTPESADLKPISNYGASKSAGEMYLRSYSSTYGIQTISLRFANIFGPRSDHGVMYDFFHKLKENPEKLTILGDGEQRKSYLYIEDCIDATLTSLQVEKDFEVFNIGSNEQISVTEIAEILSDEMDLDPDFEYMGGKKGWKGDVPEMLLDVKKIESLGWNPETPVEEGIRKYIEWL